MSSSIPIKKLFKTAFYTSVLIGTLAIVPITAIKPVSIAQFFKEIVSHTFFIFLIWTLNISLVYIIEKFIKKKLQAYTKYLLSYILCAPLFFLTIIYMKSTIQHGNETELFHGHNPELIIGKGILFVSVILGFALNTIILIIQDLILLREKKAIIELENAELKIKNVEATNQQLKQQIHPHFLFNSLSTLKTLINKNPAKAEDYLVKLSDFLRASISSETLNVTKLSNEVKTCCDYLEMQKMRFGEALQFTITIPDEIQNSGFIPVFSLLPLIENAIKHNKLTNELPLNIQINYLNGRIVTTNNLQPKPSLEPSTGFGLDNLAERYKILSGDKITIDNKGNIFSVSLKILDNENSNYRG